MNYQYVCSLKWNLDMIWRWITVLDIISVRTLRRHLQYFTSYCLQIFVRLYGFVVTNSTFAQEKPYSICISFERLVFNFLDNILEETRRRLQFFTIYDSEKYIRIVPCFFLSCRCTQCMQRKHIQIIQHIHSIHLSIPALILFFLPRISYPILAGTKSFSISSFSDRLNYSIAWKFYRQGWRCINLSLEDDKHEWLL